MKGFSGRDGWAERFVRFLQRRQLQVVEESEVLAGLETQVGGPRLQAENPSRAPGTSFPCSIEIHSRESTGPKKRGGVYDDWLPVSWSMLEAGETMGLHSWRREACARNVGR